MKNVYKILFLSLSFVFVALPFTVLAHSNDTDNSKSKVAPLVRSIWKYEQDLSKFAYDDGIAKKIYFLSLNSDGTYHQYVQLIPSNPQNFYHVRNFELNGKWYEKDGKLFLNENGKENTIDYTYLYSNFENIDNQYITAK